MFTYVFISNSVSSTLSNEMDMVDPSIYICLEDLHGSTWNILHKKIFNPVAIHDNVLSNTVHPDKNIGKSNTFADVITQPKELSYSECINYF